MGPKSFHHVFRTGQAYRRPGRARRCLLKDCEQWFQPLRPQSRYCSGGCAAAARRWRCVKASRRYRASDGGRARRCEQNRRYRQRRRQPAHSASADAAALREGQRPAEGDEDSCLRMCDRPGCYAIFRVSEPSSCRRFCSTACRLALRRVLDREWRYRQRRRRWRCARWRRRGPRPDSS